MIFAPAHAALAENSPGYALDQLRPALDYPSQLDNEADWRTALQLLTQIFTALENSRLAEPCRQATLAPASVDALHHLGSALITQRLPAIAATVLARAHGLAPQREDLLTELAAALEMVGRFEDARRHLAAAHGPGFLPRYLLAFTTLMTGDIAEARRLASALAPRTPAEEFMRTRLRESFARIDAIRHLSSLEPTDRRGWHFALTGGLLLHLPPAPTTGNGRYDNLEDSEALCLVGLQRFRAVIELWGVDIPRVLAFENPESRRLGLAMAEVLGVPASYVYQPEESGLFVAYDLGSIIPEVLASLRPRRPGLMVFSHASQWTHEQPVAGDFTTLQYASIVTPWNRHAIFPWRPDLPKGPSFATDAELAEKIVAAELPAHAQDDLPQLLALAKAAKDLASARRQTGLRDRQWIGA